MSTPKLHKAKLLLALARIISGLAMFREAVEASGLHLLSVSLGSVFSKKEPDTFHVSRTVFSLLPGHVKISPRDDCHYPFEASKEYAGARFIVLLEKKDLAAINITRRMAA